MDNTNNRCIQNLMKNNYVSNTVNCKADDDDVIFFQTDHDQVQVLQLQEVDHNRLHLARDLQDKKCSVSNLLSQDQECINSSNPLIEASGDCSCNLSKMSQQPDSAANTDETLSHSRQDTFSERESISVREPSFSNVSVSSQHIESAPVQKTPERKKITSFPVVSGDDMTNINCAKNDLHRFNGNSGQHGSVAVTSNQPDDNLSPLLPTTILLDDVLSELKFGFFQMKMIILAGGGYFAVCSEILVFVFLSTPVKKEWDLPEFRFPWLPFFSGIGGILGGYVFGILSDKCGRQIPFMVSMGVCATFGMASAFSPSFLSLVVIRSFVSVGTGGLESVDFVLLLEFLPKRNRGTVMVMVTFCGALGAVYAGGMAWLLLPRHEWGWRWFVGACAVPSIIVFVMRLFISQETPRYLFTSGQNDKALAVLRTIAKTNKTTLTEGNIVCPAVKNRGHVFELLSPELRWRTVFICLVWLFQSTGYWGVTLYLPEYMHSLGVDPYFNMFTIFLGEIPGLCLAMILIESHMLGRIKSLRFFSFFTCASLMIFSFVPFVFLKAVFVLVCYFFMVPIYAILNAFTPEIYPTSVRSTAMAMANVVIEIPGLVTPFAGEVLLSLKSTVWLYPVVWASCFGLQFLCTFGLRKETAGEDLLDTVIGGTKSRIERR